MTIEKTIAAAQEPVLELLAELEHDVQTIKREMAAPLTYEIDLEKIADTLTARAEFVQMTEGRPGTDGVAGERGEPGTPGRDGTDGAGVNVKQWEPGIYREGTLVQHDLGRVSVALRDTNEAPGGADWERIGSGGFRWCGVKQEGRAYQEGDLYIDNGTTFLWVRGKGRMFAQRGKDGADGKDGRDGTDAPQLIEARLLDDFKTLALVHSNGHVIECALPEAFAQLAKASSELATLRRELAELRAAFNEAQGAAHGN